MNRNEWIYQNRIYSTLLALLLISSTSKGQKPTLSIIPHEVEIGSNFTLTCHVEINSNIFFFVNDTQKGSCPHPAFGGPCSPADIEQNFTKQETTWILTADLEYEGNWKCNRLGVNSDVVALNMYNCPNSIDSESGIHSNLFLNETETVGITVKISCLYPTSSPTIKLRFLSSDSSMNLFKVLNCSETTGSCSTGSAYECNEYISFGMSLMDGGQFIKGNNYTLHIDSTVLPSAGTCNRLAVFEPYSLLFVSGGETSPGSPTCDGTLIYVVHFIWTLIIVVLTFFAVIFIAMKRPDIGSEKVQIFAAILIDVVLECIMLWGIEYGFDFKTFRTNDACNVAIIGTVCHVVILVILVVKIVVFIRFTEKIQELMASCCVTRITMEPSAESGPLTNRSNDHTTRNGVEQAMPPRNHNVTQSVTTPEDITLLMHFPMPTGYQVHHWVNEDSTSLQDSSRHVPSDRGTLHIKSATAKDNGIYQSLLVSGNSELRVNVILHVTGLKSVSLMVDPLVWRRIKNKKLKQIHDLKKISKHLSHNNVEGIPSNLKRSEETDVTVKSVRWTHNGKEITGPSPWKSGTDHLQRFTVQRDAPIDEYHCRIEFSDRKAHIFIFIVKFTGSEAKPYLYPSDCLPNNKVDTIEEVVGVPTIINTKREETDSKLKPLRRIDQRNSDDDDY